MSTLYVRNIPDELYTRLRQVASESHRSIGNTTIDVLKQCLGQQNKEDELSIISLLTRAEKIRSSTKPLDDAISAVELIREDRDR